MQMTFWDRRDAGRRLAALVARYGTQAPIVVAIPKGGVPVAIEVARALDAPLDTIVVKKIVAPGLDRGVGAVAEQGMFAIDPTALRSERLSRRDLETAAQREYGDLMRAVALYRGERGMPRIAGRTVIVVDDYVVTGTTARAAAGALRDLRPRRLVLAAPVIAEAASAALQADYDEVICEVEPADAALSPTAWYESFQPLTDAEALALLHPQAQQSATR
jgi:putative phosphoribosyl transferase